ncbi:MAG TPA: transcriptional regulator [Clostridiales bacterium]|nr:transcriptional regulator [Clostridiales bacterium]
MEKIDFKVKEKEFYLPKTEPSMIQVPEMNFIMVDGHGDPNEENGDYKKSIELLYALSYTIKMSQKYKKDTSAFMNLPDYVVPPLEGLWWLEDANDMDFTQKSKFCWTSMIRQPDFVTPAAFEAAKEAVQKKKPELDVTKARLERFEEGLCVQCMHIGPYDAEPATMEKMEIYVQDNNLIYDIGNPSPDNKIRRHHEIYLSDPRKANPATMRTVLRHPVLRKDPACN